MAEVIHKIKRVDGTVLSITHDPEYEGATIDGIALPAILTEEELTELRDALDLILDDYEIEPEAEDGFWAELKSWGGYIALVIAVILVGVLFRLWPKIDAWIDRL
jgi:hypothetical protein